MDIQILHIPNTFNYGSCMMAITLINQLNTSIPNLTIYTDSPNELNLNRLKTETKAANLFSNPNYALTTFSSSIKRPPILIVIGGDDFSGIYTSDLLIPEFLKLYAYTRFSKTILIGQTIGPFTDPSLEKLAYTILKDTKIYTRDDNSYDYLKHLKLTNIVSSRDLALLPLPRETESANILNTYHLKPNSYITIVPSGLIRRYTSNQLTYTQEYLKIINYLLQHPSLKDKKIVLLPHVLTHRRSDVTQINLLTPHFSSNPRVVPIVDSMLPSEARTLLGNGCFTIAGRMHATVSTLYMSKPALSLSYGPKYDGVIGRSLNLPELITKADNPTLWSNGSISKEISYKIDYILNNYLALVNKIHLQVTTATYILNTTLQELIKDIK